MKTGPLESGATLIIHDRFERVLGVHTVDTDVTEPRAKIPASIPVHQPLTEC